MNRNVNRDRKLDQKATDLFDYWLIEHDKRRTKLDALRDEHRDCVQFWDDILMNPDSPKSLRETLAKNMARGSKWRKDYAWELRRKRSQTFRNGGFAVPFGPFTVTRVANWARSLQRASRSTMRRMGGWDTDYYSACGHDDYLGDCAEQMWKESRHALRLARMLRDGIVKEVRPC